MTTHELAALLLREPNKVVGISVEGGPDHTEVISVEENENGVWICVLPEGEAP